MRGLPCQSIRTEQSITGDPCVIETRCTKGWPAMVPTISAVARSGPSSTMRTFAGWSALEWKPPVVVEVSAKLVETALVRGIDELATGPAASP